MMLQSTRTFPRAGFRGHCGIIRVLWNCVRKRANASGRRRRNSAIVRKPPQQQSCAKAGNNFAFLVLEGQVNFESQSDFYAVMKRLKKKEVTVLIVTPKPPRGISRNAIWDTVITMRRWRKHHCGKHNLVAEIRTHSGKRNCKACYQEKENRWTYIPDKKDVLKEPVREMMAAGLNAKQIVAAINASNLGLNKPLTESSLASMKRFWGFRTYRPEKKPRTRRNIQLERQETFPLLSSDETT